MHTLTHSLLPSHAHPHSSELLNLHRFLYEELSQILSLPENIQLEQFFSVLEKVFPSFSLYSSFTDSTRQLNLQASDGHALIFLLAYVQKHLSNRYIVCPVCLAKNRQIMCYHSNVQQSSFCVWGLCTEKWDLDPNDRTSVPRWQQSLDPDDRTSVPRWWLSLCPWAPKPSKLHLSLLPEICLLYLSYWVTEIRYGDHQSN